MTPASHRRLLLGALLGTLLAPASGVAQSGPALPAQVRLIVGYAAGGPVDSAARQFAPVLARELARTVIVENRPGTGGVLGADLVAKSPADGATLYFGASPTLTISPHVLKSMPLDTTKDLAPIAPVTSYANVLVVHKDLPVSNVQQLIAYAKANPGKVSYGSAGMGSSNHLSAALFARQTATALTHVPYKGNLPAMNDVIGGQLSMMFDIVSTARNFIAQGRVRPIAVTSAHRNDSLPNVPTLRESGLSGYEVIGWYGIYGPSALPADLVRQLNGAINRALDDEPLRRLWTEAGYDRWTGAAGVLGTQQRRDLELWADVTRGMTFE